MKMIEDEANSLSNNSEKQEPAEFTTSMGIGHFPLVKANQTGYNMYIL